MRILAKILIFLALSTSAHAQENLLSLRDYINNIRNEIYGAKEDSGDRPLFIPGPMELEITIGFRASSGGGAEFFVFSLDANIEGYHTQKIKIPISLSGTHEQRVDVPYNEESRKIANILETFFRKYPGDIEGWYVYGADESETLTFTRLPQENEGRLIEFVPYSGWDSQLFKRHPDGLPQKNLSGMIVLDSFGRKIGVVSGTIPGIATGVPSETVKLLVSSKHLPEQAVWIFDPGQWAVVEGGVQITEEFDVNEQ